MKSSVIAITSVCAGLALFLGAFAWWNSGRPTPAISGSREDNPGPRPAGGLPPEEMLNLLSEAEQEMVSKSPPSAHRDFVVLLLYRAAHPAKTVEELQPFVQEIQEFSRQPPQAPSASQSDQVGRVGQSLFNLSRSWRLFGPFLDAQVEWEALARSLSSHAEHEVQVGCATLLLCIDRHSSVALQASSSAALERLLRDDLVERTAQFYLTTFERELPGDSR